MKVTMCAPARFTIFDGAKQLLKHGMLRQLITQYPKFKTRQWGIPDEIVTSTLLTGVANLCIYKSLSSRLVNKSRAVEIMHRLFANTVSRHIPADTDVLYGLSSFMLETLQYAKSNGILSFVDHGSLHQRKEKEILAAECEQFGFSPFGNWQYDWLLDKEDAEFAGSDFIVVASSLARKTLINNQVPASKIYVNPLGVDMTLFYPGEKKDDIFRIIFCGGLNPLKGVHYLVKAFHELNLPNSELWLIGTPPNDDRFLAVLNKHSGNNVTMKGTFPQSELRKLFCQGSVFVLPSLSDGWGLVVLQAMACGLPVIVSDMTGAADA
ncbi:MAG: glycosyltransferase family 4 protein, partial [Nitrospirota bacterium]